MDYKKLMQEERLRIMNELSGSKSQSEDIRDETSILKPLKLIPVCHVQLKLPDSFLLSDYQIGKNEGFDSLYYIPNVLSIEDEAIIAQCVALEGENDSQRWTQLRTRRLQCWGKFPPSSDRPEYIRRENIPQWLQCIIDQITSKLPAIFDSSSPPNNVLINQYRPSEGILHHTDGPLYEDRVLILSLQSDCLMTFRKNLTSDQIGTEYAGDVFSVLLKRNSLLYFTKDLYTQYMHGIAAEDVHTVGGSCQCLNKEVCGVTDGDTVEREVRTSLTFRILRN